MATKTAEAPWATREAELEEVSQRRAALAGRAERLRLGLTQLPHREARARATALEADQGSWETVRPLHEERQEIEAELRSIQEDQDSLAIKARELEAEVNNLRAEQINLETGEIQSRQRERLAKAGRLIEALADLYPDIVADEEALADLRARITEVLGRPNHSYAKPVVEPLGVTLGLFLDQLVWAATSDAARGSRLTKNPRTEVNDNWLDALPDLRDRKETPLVLIDGVKPYTARIIQVLS